MHRKIMNDFDKERVRRLLGQEDKKFLFYHRDSDGVCSAAILLKFFPDFKAIPREGPVMGDDLISFIVSEKPEAIVFLDIPIDQEWENLLKLRKSLPKTEIMIIDHHSIEKDMGKKKGFIHINPRFVDEKLYIPAACVVYEMMKLLGKDVEPVMWISITGIIGDYGFEDCAWMFKKYAKKNKVNHGQLAKVSEIISSAITLKGLSGADKALGTLLKSRSYDEFMGSREMIEWNKVVQREVKKIVEDFEKNKEVFGESNLIFYEIKSDMNITSIIATITAEMYPDHVILIRKRSGNVWKFSIRCQSGEIDVGKLAKYCSRGLGSGGGHIKSAGAVANDWKIFRERVFEYFRHT